MKLLVTTAETQGQRSSDFCWTEPAELLIPGFECDTDHDDPDGTCGCGRSLTGLRTRGTTTGMVEEVKLTRLEFIRMVLASDNQAGFTCVTRDEAEALVNSYLAAIREFKVGAVLEYRAGKFTERRREGKR